MVKNTRDPDKEGKIENIRDVFPGEDESGWGAEAMSTDERPSVSWES